MANCIYSGKTIQCHVQYSVCSDRCIHLYNLFLTHTYMFSAGSDYIMIAEAVFAGADTISINVTVLDDGLVELPESFFLTGLVVEEDVPVAFGDRLEVFIISDEGNLNQNGFVFVPHSYTCTFQ